MAVNIVVAYKHSKVSLKLIATAIKHAKADNGSIFLVTSLQPATPQQDLAAVEEARAALEQVKNAVLKEGLACHTELIYPGLSPGTDVVEFASEKEADLIVAGVESKSKVGKLLVGSTAQDIILGARCPVVTVKLLP